VKGNIEYGYKPYPGRDFIFKQINHTTKSDKTYTNLIHNQSETISNMKYDKINNVTDFLCLTHLSYSMLRNNTKKG